MGMMIGQKSPVRGDDIIISRLFTLTLCLSGLGVDCVVAHHAPCARVKWYVGEANYLITDRRESDS